MDKQRFDAYLNLINALLECPSGQENEILQAHSDLVDWRLVQAMEWVAAKMAEEGDPNAAGRLRDFAARLAVETTWEDYWNLMEVLWAVRQNPAPEAVFPLLQQNLDKLDENLWLVLQDFGESLQQQEPERARGITADIVNFSNLMQQFPLGDRAINLEIAIAGHEIGLTFFLPQEFPQEWATIQNNLGAAYSQRIAGERSENIEKAISCCNDALEVYTRSAFPVQWACTQTYLGIAYKDRIAGERSENIERAIGCFNEALEVYTRSAFPVQWAVTQNNLGNAYSDRIAGERSENIERVISCCNDALTVLTHPAFPLEWASTQNSLGNAYYERIAGERSENIEKAICCFSEALEVRTRSAFPVEWADIQNNLGNAYHNRIAGERSENIEKGISCYNEALEVRTRSAFPVEWATIENNLGAAYSDRIAGERSENIEKGISCYNDALEVRTRSAFPVEWAMTQNNLGAAYLRAADYKRIAGERSENIEKAISCCNDALEVYTRSAFPVEWASTQNNLGAAYRRAADYADYKRIAGERSENIEKAISCCNDALEVYTRSAFPVEWAMTQDNLGGAYYQRIAGERSENIERAISCYNDALTVRSRSAIPVDWAMNQHNLGLAYKDRIAGERSENIERAISCYNDAQKVYTRSALPVDWAMIQISLGIAYSDRIAGKGSENIERAIGCYNEALTVLTHSAFPVEWAITQHNLGNAYLNRIAGERSEDIERAISCYNDALEIRTRSAFPVHWAMTELSLGIAYYKRIAGERSKNIENVIACFNDALTVYTPSAFPLECLKAGGNLGNTAFTAGFWETAIEGYGLAIEALEKSRAWASTEERRQEILEESIGVFENMVQACVNTGQLDKALEYVERSRSKRLADLIAHNDLYAQGEIPPEIQEIIDKINQLQQQIDEIRSENNPQSDRELAGTRSTKCDKAALAARNEKIAALEAEKLQQRQKLYKFEPAIAGLPLNFTQLQNLIDQPTTAILSFYTTGDHTHIFILGQDQITCHTCPGQGRKTLQNWIGKNWLRSYINISRAAIFAAAKILRCRLPAVNSVNIADDSVVVKLNDGYEQFIAKPEFEEVRQQEKARLRGIWMKKMHPIFGKLAQRLRLNDLIAQHLEGISELILIPHLYLHVIPLAALPLGEGEYLGDKFLIRTLPSCQILDFCHQNPALDGNLTMGIVEDATNDLHFSNWEAETVAQLYNIPDRLRLKKEKAKVSEYQKLLQQVNSLLSTHHAQSRLDNPLESALILADGKITLGQMLTPGWRFPHLEEVFLSCCETNLAQVNITDDILTIGIGFICAGARSVISTLWAVELLATTIFSIYYHQYRQGTDFEQPLSRPEALQKAQQKLRTVTKSEVEQMLSSAYSDTRQRASEVKKTSRKEWLQLLALAKIISQGQEYLKNFGEIPFASPQYWGAFICQGLP